MIKELETQGEVVPHPPMVAEHWEGAHGCRGLPEGMRGPGPKQGLPNPGLQSQEECAQNLTVKTSGNSGHLGETERTRNPRHPL